MVNDVCVLVHVETDEPILFQEALRVEDFDGYDGSQLVQTNPMVHVEVAVDSVVSGQNVDVLQEQGVGIAHQFLQSGFGLAFFQQVIEHHF